MGKGNNLSKWRRPFWVALVIVLGAIPSAPASAQTQQLNGEVADEKGAAIAKAVCTLQGPGLSQEGLSTTTADDGKFSFQGLIPGQYELMCAALGYQPVVQPGIEVSEAQTPSIQVVLPPEIIIRQNVEVSEKAPTISQEDSAPPATLSSQRLLLLPLTEQKFKAALPLVPGVVRTPNGKIYIKGQVETQGMLLVDSAETVDPVTGSFSIGVPVDAIESINVYKTTYQAEFGRFSGGLTSIHTKSPSSQWRAEVNDFMPDFRGKSGHLVGLADVTPRFSLTGPLWPNKLNFSESFTYEMAKQPVRGLSWPRNETKTQGFNSFTNFQYIVSSRHLLTGNVNVFPLRRQFADINSLVPQSASSDYGQAGHSVGLTDRYLLDSGGILTTLAKYTRFSGYAHGQGSQDMLVTPNGWGGNFFNSWSRGSDQQELLQNYEFPRQEWLGRHGLKVGGEYIHRSYRGISFSHPVLLLRPDNSLAERIDFSGPASLAVEDTEVAAFFEDHWAFNDHLAFDLGLRYAGQTIGTPAAIGPRAGFVYSPGDGGKTIFRGGIGVFHDRVPLLAGDFSHNPTRTVTFFDQQGVPIGSPLVFRNAYVKVDERGRSIIPPGQDLASTPYNLTWNLEVDQELSPRTVLRLSYVSSRSYQQFVIDPERLPTNDSVLLLTNTGRSRYHEFETTLRLRPSQQAEANISYVHSLARGDLNSLSQIFVPFEQPVIRPNYFADLPSNVPDRLIAWGRFKAPWGITTSPVLDWHTGFPYSSVDVLQNYASAPNGQRFPSFFSLDLKLSKDFRIAFIPWLKNHKVRGGFYIFNLTNHSNPRDVFSSVVSPFFGSFVGIQHRLFEGDVDILF